MFRKDQKVPKIKLLASETWIKRSLTWRYTAIRGTQWHQIAQTLQYQGPVALAQQSWSNEAELALSTPTLSAIVLLLINRLKCLPKANALKSDALKLGRLKYPLIITWGNRIFRVLGQVLSGERIPSPLGGSATRNREDRLWEKVSKLVLGN